MIDFPAIALQCGPEVTTEVIHRIVSVESSFNPYAIGIVGGYLERQPKTREEAVATAQYLAENGWNFSMGLAQVNRYNLSKYGLDYDSVFEPCSNLRAAAAIYQECFNRAYKKTSDYADARLKAFSCYYSGNFSRGFIADGEGKSSYVQRIVNVKIDKPSTDRVMPIPVVPYGSKKNRSERPRENDTKVSGTATDRRLRKINSAHSGTSGGIKQLRGK